MLGFFGYPLENTREYRIAEIWRIRTKIRLLRLLARDALLL